MSYQPSIGADHERRRVSNACRVCRQRKVKCSGRSPCLNCVNRRQACVYDETERRVVILERHLRTLQRRALISESPSADAASRARFTENPTDAGEQNVETPIQAFPGTAGATVAGPNRQLKEPRVPFQLASTWDLSRKARQFLKPEPDQVNESSPVDEKKSYDISFHDILNFDPSALPLPSKDYIIHLADVANFHLNSLHYFFHHVGFKEQLEQTFQPSSQASSRLWHVKVLLIIAVGKLFLEKGASESGPPGVNEFRQGVNALPSSIVLSQDPVTAVEVLCLLSFYAQAADLHEISFLYIGQASRITRHAAFRGMCVMNDSSDSQQQRCALKLLCTVCVLDQRHSAAICETVEYPAAEQLNIANSSDINPGHFSDATLQISLSIANKLTSITKVLARHGWLDDLSHPFLAHVVELLKGMQGLGQQIISTQRLCYDGSLSTISKTAAALHLMYYHCIITATKPALLHLVKSTLSCNDISRCAPPDCATKLTQTCVMSATLSLSIVSVLHDQGLMEAFPFFNLEITFLAAICLMLARSIIPIASQDSLINVARKVLQAMANRGNIPAASLRDELDRIYRLASQSSEFLETHHLLQGIGEIASRIDDAEALNGALVSVLDIQCSDSSSSQNLDELRGKTACTQEPETRPSNPRRLATPSVENSTMLQSNEIYLNDVGLAGNQFTFDWADLQWLDSVQ